MSLVAHTGFEPVISSLRGMCPRPLDECAKGILLSLERGVEVKQLKSDTKEEN